MLAPPPALATVTVGRLGTGPPRTASFFPAHCKVQKKTERKEGPSTAMTLGPQPTAICSGANVCDGFSFFLVVLSYGGGGGENRRRAELRDCAYPEEPAWELECDFRFVRVGLSGLSCTKTAFTAVQYVSELLLYSCATKSSIVSFRSRNEPRAELSYRTGLRAAHLPRAHIPLGVGVSSLWS